MSLESALDEERREVMRLLEGRGAGPAQRPTSPHASGRAQSPAAAVSPIRSMLDVGVTPSSPRLPVSYGSMLSPASPGRASSRGPMPSSPPPTGRILNPEAAYQFQMMPTIEAHSMPKRVTQGGKKKDKKDQRAMSSVYGKSSDILGTTRDRDRHSSFGGLLGKPKSGSPGPSRSQSPGARMLNTNSFNLMPNPNQYVTDSGKVVDMNSAYRRLSDGAMLRSGGTLSTLPIRKGSDPTKGVEDAPGGGVRLTKDEYDGDERAVESSDDDDDDDSSGSSDGEGWGGRKRRGRRRTRDDDGEKHGSEKKTPKSLLAAAEAERESYPEVRSLSYGILTFFNRQGRILQLQSPLTARARGDRDGPRRRETEHKEERPHPTPHQLRRRIRPLHPLQLRHRGRPLGDEGRATTRHEHLSHPVHPRSPPVRPPDHTRELREVPGGCGEGP